MKVRYVAVRRLEIDAAHRLLNHKGKCHELHGHRYVFEVACSAEQTDDVGVVIDFADVKRVVGGWLDEAWDHGYIHEHGDVIAATAEAEMFKTYCLDAPPTAENLARHLYVVATQLLASTGISVSWVKCWETPNCWAAYPALEVM